MQKVFLYISAFIPLYSLIILKLIIEILNNNLTLNVLNTIALILLCVLITLGITGLIQEKNSKKNKIIKIKIIKKTSITQQHFLGYFSLFVLFALNFELEKISMFIIFLIILILIGIVYIKNDLFYINPLLNILGYNFYDVQFKDENGKIKKAKFYAKGKVVCEEYTAKIGDKNFNYIFKKNKP